MPLRRLALVLLAAAVVVVSTAAAPAGASAAAPPQSPSTTTTDDTATGAPAPDIIPEPDSGAPPDEAGDRGGALQLAVLGLMVAGLGVIATLAVRESRRRRAGSGTGGRTSSGVSH